MKELSDMQSSCQIITTNKPMPNIFTILMPFLLPYQQCQSTEERKYQTPWTCSPHVHLGVFRPCLNH